MNLFFKMQLIRGLKIFLKIFSKKVIRFGFLLTYMGEEGEDNFLT